MIIDTNDFENIEQLIEFLEFTNENKEWCKVVVPAQREDISKLQKFDSIEEMLEGLL